MSSQSSTIYFMQWCTCSSWSGCRLVNNHHQMVRHQPSLSVIVIKAYGDLGSHLETWYKMAVLFPNFRKNSKSCLDIKCSYCNIIQQEEIRYTTSNQSYDTYAHLVQTRVKKVRYLESIICVVAFIAVFAMIVTTESL